MATLPEDKDQTRNYMLLTSYEFLPKGVQLVEERFSRDLQLLGKAADMIYNVKNRCFQIRCDDMEGSFDVYYTFQKIIKSIIELEIGHGDEVDEQVPNEFVQRVIKPNEKTTANPLGSFPEAMRGYSQKRVWFCNDEGKRLALIVPQHTMIEAARLSKTTMIRELNKQCIFVAANQVGVVDQAVRKLDSIKKYYLMRQTATKRAIHLLYAEEEMSFRGTLMLFSHFKKVLINTLTDPVKYGPRLTGYEFLKSRLLVRLCKYIALADTWSLEAPQRPRLIAQTARLASRYGLWNVDLWHEYHYPAHGVAPPDMQTFQQHPEVEFSRCPGTKFPETAASRTGRWIVTLPSNDQQAVELSTEIDGYEGLEMLALDSATKNTPPKVQDMRREIYSVSMHDCPSKDQIDKALGRLNAATPLYAPSDFKPTEKLATKSREPIYNAEAPLIILPTIARGNNQSIPKIRDGIEGRKNIRYFEPVDTSTEDIHKSEKNMIGKKIEGRVDRQPPINFDGCLLDDEVEAHDFLQVPLQPSRLCEVSQNIQDRDGSSADQFAITSHAPRIQERLEFDPRVFDNTMNQKSGRRYRCWNNNKNAGTNSPSRRHSLNEDLKAAGCLRRDAVITEPDTDEQDLGEAYNRPYISEWSSQNHGLRSMPQQLSYAPKDDPNPTFVTILNQRLLEILRLMRDWSGGCTLEAHIGRMVVESTHQGNITVGDSTVKAEVPTDVCEHLQRNCQTKFTRILTSLPHEVSYVIQLPTIGRPYWLSNGKAEKAPKQQVWYEIIAISSVNKESVTMLIDVKTLAFEIKKNISFGDVNIHCLKRNWDVQISATGAVLMAEKYAGFAAEVIKSFYVKPSQAFPELSFRFDKSHKLQIKTVRALKRCSFVGVNGRSTLNVTEVVPLALEQYETETEGCEVVHIQGKPATNTDPGHEPLWFEVSVSSILIDNEFEANNCVEVGEEATWTVENFTGLDGVEAVYRPALQMVKLMNDVGFNNNNGIRFEDEDVSAAQTENTKPTKTEQGYW